MKPNSEEMLSPLDVVSFLGVGRNTVYSLLRTGKLKAFRVGSKWRIPQKSIQEYIDRSVSDETESKNSPKKQNNKRNKN